MTLHSAQPQLESVKREKSELLQQCSLLADRVSVLEIALAKANRFANYDELTGLPNRRLLLDRFALAAALAKRHRHSLALLFFDINHFKTVNDKLGHETGDKLLQQVASRLSKSIRESDTACRYGGDEFVILLTEINSHEHAATTLQNIRSRLAPPYGIDRHSLRLSASVGLAIYPQEAQRLTDLLRLADRSMFSNKSGIRGRSGDTDQRLGPDELAMPCAPHADADVSFRLDGIVAGFCTAAGLDPDLVVRPGRQREAARVRGLICSEALSSGTATLSELAAYFGRAPEVISRGIACHRTVPGTDLFEYPRRFLENGAGH